MVLERESSWNAGFLVVANPSLESIPIPLGCGLVMWAVRLSLGHFSDQIPTVLSSIPRINGVSITVGVLLGLNWT